VRENIFKRQENGEPAASAALSGAREVALAVVATTATVIAVFLPIAFLNGVVGQFFKQFGLTVVFAMAISLFDALTIAPMLSAYLTAGGGRHGAGGGGGILARLLKTIDRWQSQLENAYAGSLQFTLKRPGLILISAFGLFLGSLVIAGFVPKTFLPPQDNGQFAISLELEPGASLEATAKDADRDAGIQFSEIASILHRFERDDRAAERKRDREEQCRKPAEAEQPYKSEPEQSRDENLSEADRGRHASYIAHGRRRQVQSDDEQQRRDAELGKNFHRRRVVDPPEDERTREHARQNVSQNQRELHPLEQERDGRREGEDERELKERLHDASHYTKQNAPPCGARLLGCGGRI
jgi:multidrug efflux pump subunit AcrB